LSGKLISNEAEWSRLMLQAAAAFALLAVREMGKKKNIYEDALSGQ
jgi:hypothetical protein